MILQPFVSAARTAIYFRCYVPVFVFLGFSLLAYEIRGRWETPLLLTALCAASLCQAVYVFNKLYDTVEDAVNAPDEVLPAWDRWAYLLGAAALTLVPLVHILTVPTVRVIYPFMALLGALYSYPFGRSGFRLKNHFITEFAAFLALFYGMVVLMPLIQMGIPLRVIPENPGTFLSMASPLLVLVVINDIRDVKGDAEAGVRSLPVVIGARPTLILIGAVLVAQLFFALREPRSGVDIARSVVLLIWLATLPRAKHHLAYHAGALIELIMLMIRIAMRAW